MMYGQDFYLAYIQGKSDIISILEMPQRITFEKNMINFYDIFFIKYTGRRARQAMRLVMLS